MAEREGFEPPIALRACLISSQVQYQNSQYLKLSRQVDWSGATGSVTWVDFCGMPSSSAEIFVSV